MSPAEPSSDGAQPQPVCRGVRGATTLAHTGTSEVDAAVAELLDRMLQDNQATPGDVAALFFTVPEDLPKCNPAASARAHGMELVPLLVVRENGGDTRVERCLRALALINTRLPQAGVRHAYLRGARELRPDLVGGR